jgi:hypothetical protein
MTLDISGCLTFFHVLKHYYTTKQVIQNPTRVLVEREVCNRIDGCPIVNNVCVDCITVKN